MESDVITMMSSDDYSSANDEIPLEPINFLNSTVKKENCSIKKILIPNHSIALHELAKDRQKKDNHNMIERRRRFNINDRIKELGTLLPRHDDPYFELVRDLRRNKGTILRASVAYLRCLKQDASRIPHMEEQHKQMEMQNRTLSCRIQKLESILQVYGIPFPSQSECCKTAIESSISHEQELKPPNEHNHSLTSTTPPTSPSSGTSMSSPFREYEDLIDDDDDGPVNASDPLLCGHQESIFPEFILV